MQIDRIGTDAQVFVGEDYDSSSLVLVRGSDALLVEALGSRRDAADLEKWLAERNLDVRIIVSTHYFSDHLAAIERFPSAIVITHELWRDVWGRETFRSDEEASWLIEPTITMVDRLKLRWGRFDLELFHNPGHTPATLNVDIPALDLVHVGDTLVGNLAYLRYSSPDAVLEAISTIRERGRSKVISSHGTVRDAAALDRVEHYVRSLSDRVERSKRNGRSRDEVLKIAAADCYPGGSSPYGVRGDLSSSQP